MGIHENEMVATYSPEDNKLRLRCAGRLDAATYKRVSSAGFRWAGKQCLFWAPAWTPEREALLEELCGEIGDEDTTLCERAAERSERFEGYQVKRTADAAAAVEAVDQLSQRFEFGQPVLVGHYSQRRAERDRKRIQDGMHRAVRLWDTAEYWERRALAAHRHAEYRQKPAVRRRRLMSLAAERRGFADTVKQSEALLSVWGKDGLTLEQAKALANRDNVVWTLWSRLDRGEIGVDAAKAEAVARHQANVNGCKKWLQHLDHRIAYEKAFLGVADDFEIAQVDVQRGGTVQVRGSWFLVLRVNRGRGVISTLQTEGGKVAAEEVEGYRDPEPGVEVALKMAGPKRPPIANCDGEGFRHMTKAEWGKFPRDYKAVRTSPCGKFRYRQAMVGTPRGCTLVRVYLSDQKQVTPAPGVEVAG